MAASPLFSARIPTSPPPMPASSTRAPRFRPMSGMSGPYDSVIGVETELVVNRFLTGMPGKFEAAKGNPKMSRDPDRVRRRHRTRRVHPASSARRIALKHELRHPHPHLGDLRLKFHGRHRRRIPPSAWQTGSPASVRSPRAAAFHTLPWSPRPRPRPPSPACGTPRQILSRSSVALPIYRSPG